MTVAVPYRHRVRLPSGAEPVVSVGDEVLPGDAVATIARPSATAARPWAMAAAWSR